MDEYASLIHTKWDCKYHIVFIPKCRRKVLYKTLRQHLAEVFRDLAQQRECKIEEGHLMSDHVHILISIPPKYAVSQVVGYIKGKSAIHLARTYGERKQNYVGQHFWARGYLVSTVGRDEAVIDFGNSVWPTSAVCSGPLLGTLMLRVFGPAGA